MENRLLQLLALFGIGIVKMKKYSFSFDGTNGYNEKKYLYELINYLESNYKLKYIGIVDINSKISISLKIVSLNFFNKEILFEVPKSFMNIPLCKKCRFPVQRTDLKPFQDNLQYGDKQCRNCGESIWRFKSEGWEFLKDKIIYFR